MLIFETVDTKSLWWHHAVALESVQLTSHIGFEMNHCNYAMPLEKNWKTMKTRFPYVFNIKFASLLLSKKTSDGKTKHKLLKNNEACDAFVIPLFSESIVAPLLRCCQTPNSETTLLLCNSDYDMFCFAATCWSVMKGAGIKERAGIPLGSRWHPSPPLLSSHLPPHPLPLHILLLSSPLLLPSTSSPSTNSHLILLPFYLLLLYSLFSPL